MNYNHINENAQICIICESSSMAEGIKTAFGPIGLINKTILVQAKKVTGKQDLQGENVPPRFRTANYEEFWILCDGDGGGVVNTGVAFITIKRYHRRTPIYARRIEGGAGGDGVDLRRIIQDPHTHLDRVGIDIIDDVGPLREAWKTVFRGEQDIEETPPLLSVQYLLYLKRLYSNYKGRYTTYNFQMGRRPEVKWAIIKYMVDEYHRNPETFHKVDLICVSVRSRMEREGAGPGSRAATGIIMNILAEMGKGSIKILLENQDRPNDASVNHATYLSYKLNKPVFSAIFPLWNEHDNNMLQLIPFGPFYGVPKSYGVRDHLNRPYHRGPVEVEHIMRHLYTRSLGLPTRGRQFSEFERSELINYIVPQFAPNLLHLWQLLEPARLLFN